MEAQLHGHEDGGTHSVAEGGDEGEKKSTLKKVKDKAKKIKHTIKKHVHLHHNDDQEAHHGPVHESTVARSTNLLNESDSNPSVPDNSPANLPLHSTSTTTKKRRDDGLNSGSNAVSEQKNPKSAGKISSGRGSSGVGGDEESNKGQSMKEYLCEKLKPGDEDKALSEAITHALIHKKAASEPKRGKVTVSKEVAERLGSTQENKREGEDALAAGEDSRNTGQGVAESLQNALTSWLRKSNGIETAQDSIGNAFVNHAAGATSKG